MACFLIGCQTHADVARGVFTTPSEFVGHSVRVCGFLTGTTNFWQSNPDIDQEAKGISLIDGAGLTRDREGQLCLEGVMERLGCGAEVVCTGYSFEYGLRVNSIENAQ